jgi:hypothetical protein
MENFKITEIASSRNENFEIDQTLYALKFNDILTNFEEAQELIYKMFQDIVQIFTRKMKKKDKIRIIFEHRDLKECIDLPFVLRDDFTAELLMQAFESVMQSYLAIIGNLSFICFAN